MRTSVVLLLVLCLSSTPLRSQEASNLALVNGRWFDGQTFQQRTFYSVDGTLRSAEPRPIHRTVDLAGAWIVPPFAEAHNHNIDGVDEARATAALRRYAADGVLYVKIQGNYPLSEELRRRLPMNRPGAPEVALAQTFLTASGGHPIALHETVLFAQGYYANLAREDLADRLYFTLDTSADVERKWPAILALRPDFIKTNLWFSEEYELRRDDPAYFGRKALDPAVLPLVVRRAHAAGLEVSAHTVTGTDFHNALVAGVDEIVHAPSAGALPEIESRMAQLAFGGLVDEEVRAIAAALARVDPGDASTLPLRPDDARLAARRGTVVVTTMANQMRTPPPLRERFRAIQAATLRQLKQHGVTVAVGSDNIQDTSVAEAVHLASLGVYDNRELLTLWSATTPRAIFPGRRIGALRDGYEASFLALEGNPLEDFGHVRRIRLKFKQGVEVGVP